MAHPAANAHRDGATAWLATLAATLNFDDMDAAGQHALHRHTLDTLAACIAGSNQPVTRIAEQVLSQFSGPPTVPVPGNTRRFDALSAAYLIGGAAHGLEVDDGARAGSVHPGVVVLPPLLAAVPLGSYDGKTLLSAIAAGYEVAVRVGEAIHPASRRRGFHNTSVAGVFAAAAAVGRLRGLSAATLEQAFGIAASSAAGLFAFLHGGGEIKRLHPGHAAREGLLAVLLAEQGMTGPEGVLEIRDGLFQAFSDSRDRPRLTASVATRGSWAVSQCYIKPYACCRHLHPAVDGVLDIVAREAIAPGDISVVEVGTYAIAADHAHTGWQDMATAQMSFPFVLAGAMLGGAMGLEDFSPAARSDPARTALCAKVRVHVDDECETTYPDKRSARVKLTTRAGAVHERFVPEPYGAPANPISDEALAAKFTGLVTPVLGAERAARIKALVADLANLAHAGDLCAALAAS